MFGISKLKRDSHSHKTIVEPVKGLWWENDYYTIDEAVAELWLYRDEVNKIRKELNAINAHWVKLQCGGCAHKPICKITLEYGQECENFMEQEG